MLRAGTGTQTDEAGSAPVTVEYDRSSPFRPARQGRLLFSAGSQASPPSVAGGLDLLGRSGPLLIACGRFLPGVRCAVNVMMGMTEYPYRRFLLFSAIGGTAWAIYTCVLAYLVSTALADFALASIVISGLITSVLVGGVYWIDRRRRSGDEPSPAAVETGAVGA